MAIELLPQVERIIVNDALKEGFATLIGEVKERKALEVSPLQKLSYLQALALSKSVVDNWKMQTLKKLFEEKQDALFVYLAVHRFETDINVISLDVHLNNDYLLRTSVCVDFGPSGPHYPQWTSVVNKATGSEYDVFLSDIGMVSPITQVSGYLFNGAEEDYQYKVQISLSDLEDETID